VRARAVWFVAGSAVGVYASAKVRRAAYRLSMPGLVDQAAALGHGWRAFADEVRDGMDAAEGRLARQVGAPDASDTGGPARASLGAAPHDLPDPRDERDHP
jgi:hypothetical protein